MNDNDKMTLIVIVGILLFFGAVLTGMALFANGIPRTHNGHIIYVSHRYDKLYDYDWTDVEVLTYSGDSHHIYFWGHVDFDLNTNYHIHTVKESRFFPLPFPVWETKETVTELEIVEAS